MGLWNIGFMQSIFQDTSDNVTNPCGLESVAESGFPLKWGGGGITHRGRLALALDWQYLILVYDFICHDHWFEPPAKESHATINDYRAILSSHT